MKSKPRVKMHVRKGDTVHIIAGKEAGGTENRLKRGKVLDVDRIKGRVIVERMNFIKRHTRPDRTNRQGGIVEKEAFMNASNVMVVCPACDKPRRIKMLVLDDGSKVRACRKCGEVLGK